MYKTTKGKNKSYHNHTNLRSVTNELFDAIFRLILNDLKKIFAYFW